MASDERRVVEAFDADAIRAGNYGLSIDHEKVEREADALLARMSLAQKIHEIRGLQPQPIDGLYYAGGDASLGLAPWKMVDGPRGARAGKATAFPVAIARAASFDADLERRVGEAIGLEVAARGGNVLLAPTINLLRHPGWGRAQETYSEDPFHTGVMGLAFVCGAQNHVLTSPKHLALNNLENTRFELTSDIDLRSLHEVYLPHFKRCVVEGAAASVMSAYNKVNGTYCGENPLLLDEILRKDWKFRGFVESDWFLGTRSTAEALQAGLDIEMPAGFRFADDKLEAALAEGTLDEAVIDRAARRSIHQKLAWRVTEDGVAGRARPGADVVECEAHVALAREAAEKSIVLLKNADEVLPLERGAGRRIAVVGDLADVENLGDRGSSMVTSTSVSLPRAAIEAAAEGAEVTYFPSHADLSGLDAFDVAVVVVGLTYLDEGEFIPTAQKEAEGSDLARGGDRPDLALPLPQRDVIERAVAHAKKVVVVLQGGSAIVVREWVDRVDALLMTWYGGLEGGHALARVLFGDVSPSGRLPVSVPRDQSQMMPWDVAALVVPHDLYPGYRWLDRQGETPEFPFGFGLGYTRFETGDLVIEREDAGFRCRVGVRNVGERSGATVIQLYVGHSDSAIERPLKELKGFGRVELDAGEAVTLAIDVRDEDLCYYDGEAKAWRLEECGYVFSVGQSSEDRPLVEVWRHASGRWSAV